MTETKHYFPWQVISDSWLKVLAMTSMLIYHMAAFYLKGSPQMHEPLFSIGHWDFSPYVVMRCVGRVAFPIFTFLLVEGFCHTRSRRRYGLSLYSFALLSELPWNLVHSGTWHCPGTRDQVCVLSTSSFHHLSLASGKL